MCYQMMFGYDLYFIIYPIAVDETLNIFPSSTVV